MWRRISDDHGSGTDHGASANVHRSNEDRPRADRRPVVDESAVPMRRARVSGSRMADVGEHRAGANEDVRAKDNAVPNARMALDARAGSDDRARSDIAKGTHDDVRAEMCSSNDDARRVDLGWRSRTFPALHGQQYRLDCDRAGYAC